MISRNTHRFGAILALVLLAGAMSSQAQAQAWPLKQPIKLIAVFPPGGSVDQVARNP